MVRKTHPEAKQPLKISTGTAVVYCCRSTYVLLASVFWCFIWCVVRTTTGKKSDLTERSVCNAPEVTVTNPTRMPQHVPCKTYYEYKYLRLEGCLPYGAGWSYIGTQNNNASSVRPNMEGRISLGAGCHNNLLNSSTSCRLPCRIPV